MVVKNTDKLCIIIPAFNESKVIGNVINAIKRESGKSNLNCDIIVVNDGSTDNTSEVAISAGAIVINHLLNMGVGAATATGMSFARKQDYLIAATIDGDGQHNPKDLIKGIKLIQKNDVDLLVGNRLIRSTGMSKTKRVGNKVLSYLTYLCFGVKITDSQSGLRIYSSNSIKNLRWHNNGYEFCSEMLWRAKQENLIISDYPIKAIYTNYSKQKGQNNWNGFNIIKSIIKHRIMEIFG